LSRIPSVLSPHGSPRSALLLPFTFFLFTFLFTTGLAPQSAQPADVIFLNGNIYPGAIQDGPQVRVLPRAEALAVREGRIIAAGSNADIEKLKGSATEVVDLGGRFAMPGFNDAHLHLASGGFEQLNVSLSLVPSLEEMQGRIAERVKTAEPGEWITGRGWDHTLWKDQRLPTRHDIDKVVGDRPAIFNRTDGHIAVASSAALRLGGVTRETQAPPAGAIDRDPQGEPTGVLRETAMGLVTRHIPAPSASQRRRAVELALAEAARHGVTSAQDGSAWPDFLVYQELHKAGKLTLRIHAWQGFDTAVETLQQRRASHTAGDLMLQAGMLKGYMDGTLGSRTAAMLEPFSDDPGNRGLPRYEQARLNALARERVAAGFQLGFHAIGDGGVEMALNAFEDAQRHLREQGSEAAARAAGLRLRLEHAQVTTPEQYRRARSLGVVASMQPNHLLTDMNWAESRIGPERKRHSYAWRSFLDAGVVLAFGTDYPVEPISPFRVLYAAVTRRNQARTAEYVPEEKLTIHEAIAGYTTGSAYAEFAEREKGTLEPGKLADFIVLDRDITTIPSFEILNTRVLRTVVGGRTVHEAP
jgi:predicted amidohydrolase YtcJ